MSEQNLKRIQKFIADAGLTSRRKAEEWVLQGRVELNGQLVRELGTKVNPKTDVVSVDGEPIDANRVSLFYIVLNKPRGVMTTTSDPEGRQTVVDLCAEISERIYPVGRLDYLSEGLLIMTNDGEVANKIIHPRFEVEKVYEVKVFGHVNPEILEKMREGAQLEIGFVKPLSIRVIKKLTGKTWLEFRLGEGRNREIRRFCEAHGLTVDKLKRVAIGGLTVNGIAPGKYRMVSKQELLRSIGMDENGVKKGNRTYHSQKKTIRGKKLFGKNSVRADESKFKQLRRENYFETLAKRKQQEIERKRKEAMRRASYRKKPGLTRQFFLEDNQERIPGLDAHKELNSPVTQQNWLAESVKSKETEPERKN